MTKRGGEKTVTVLRLWMKLVTSGTTYQSLIISTFLYAFLLVSSATSLLISRVIKIKHLANLVILQDLKKIP